VTIRLKLLQVAFYVFSSMHRKYHLPTQEMASPSEKRQIVRGKHSGPGQCAGRAPSFVSDSFGRSRIGQREQAQVCCWQSAESHHM
jgi:hypothetical protein